jgi:hypothetical protein
LCHCSPLWCCFVPKQYIPNQISFKKNNKIIYIYIYIKRGRKEERGIFFSFPNQGYLSTSACSRVSWGVPKTLVSLAARLFASPASDSTDGSGGEGVEREDPEEEDFVDEDNCRYQGNKN